MLAAILCLVLAVSETDFTDRWTRSFKTHGRPRLELVSEDAEFRVETWDRPMIEAWVRTVGWTIGPEGVTIQARQQGDRILIQAELPRLSWTRDLREHYYVIEIHCPRALDLEIRGGDGGVEVQGLEGAVRIRSGDGAIEVRRLTGEIELVSRDGAIRAEYVSGRVRATTGHGRVVVAGRLEAVDVESGDGDVQVDAARGSRLARDWAVHVDDGPIVLNVPRDLDAQLDARTQDGTVAIDLPVELPHAKRRTQAKVALNQGGKTIRLATGNGEIRVGASP